MKSLTILLNLTNIVEAQLKERILENEQYKKTFDQLIMIVHPENRNKILDPKEDISYVLELKIFWLLCVLIFRKEKAKIYLEDTINLKEFINKKSKFIREIFKAIRKDTNLNIQKRKAISRCIHKFYEFVYYHLIDNDDLIRKYSFQTEFVDVLNDVWMNKDEVFFVNESEKNKDKSDFILLLKKLLK